ncbi:MAG: hypothetical protein AB8G99_11925 [Planctomycetaceae bacterium]
MRQPSLKRSLAGRFAVAMHVALYGLYVAWFAFLAAFIAVNGVAGSPRTDEVLLLVVFGLGAPFVLILLVTECQHYHSVPSNREAFLAKAGIACGLIPLVYAVFAFSEFIRFGAWWINGVPGVIAIVTGAIWIGIDMARLHRSRTRPD